MTVLTPSRVGARGGRGVLSRKHGNVLDGSGRMLGVESFALVSSFALVEAHGLVLSTVSG